MTKFINTFCEGLVSSPEPKPKPQTPQIPKIPSLKNFSKINEDTAKPPGRNEDNPSSRRRSTNVPPIHRMTVFLPFENAEGTGLGWDEYQEMKLIFYSANFKGKESISLEELKDR